MSLNCVLGKRTDRAGVDRGKEQVDDNNPREQHGTRKGEESPARKNAGTAACDRGTPFLIILQDPWIAGFKPLH